MDDRRFFRPCPCCGSNQVQLCIDANNVMKDRAKCRECGVTGLLPAWNRRPLPVASPAALTGGECQELALLIAALRLSVKSNAPADVIATDVELLDRIYSILAASQAEKKGEA